MVYPTYDPLDHSLLITYYESDSWNRIPLTTTSIVNHDLKKGNHTPSVFPNPSSGIFNVCLNQDEKSCLTIMDTFGRIVFDEIMDSFEYQRILDLTLKPKGVYFIRIQSKTNTSFQKIILR